MDDNENILTFVQPTLEQVFGLTDDMDIETKTLEKHIWAVRQKLESDPPTGATCSGGATLPSSTF